MLSAIHLGNFKAFADTQRLPIKPLTLVFGPNSAGKSSLIHGLLLASEALQTGDFDVQRTSIGGESVDLGGFRQYIHRRQPERQLEWSADIDLSRAPEDLAAPFVPAQRLTLSLAMGIAVNNQGEPLPEVKPTVTSYELIADGESLLRCSHRPDGFMQVDQFNFEHAVWQQALEQIAVRVIPPLTADDRGQVETSNSEPGKGSSERRHQLKQDISTLIEMTAPLIMVRSTDFPPRGFSYDRLPPVLVALVPGASDQATVLQEVNPQQVVVHHAFAALDSLLSSASKLLTEELTRLRYLGPLRSYPPRHLAFAQEHDTNWVAGGGYAWDEVRHDEHLRSLVNTWLGDPDRLKTPYELVVRELVNLDDLAAPMLRELEEMISPTPHFKEVSLDAPLSSAHTQAYSYEPWGDEPTEEEFRALEEQAKAEQAEVDSDQAQYDDVYAIADDADAAYDKDFDDYEPGDYEFAIHEPEEVEFEEYIEAEYEDYEEDDEQYEGEYAEEESQLAMVDPVAHLTRLLQAARVSSIERVRELVLLDQRTKTVVSHRDIGIGVSQVLPVLVNAYANRNSIVAIEQPEIHLHPALQAELADVFIESALGERCNTFILETHSEHLILRIMRRMRQTADEDLPDGLPPVRPEDVAIVYVQPHGSASVVRVLELDEEGQLLDPWPGGFFEEGYRERFS